MDSAAINTLTFTWIADSIPALACYVDNTFHYRFMNAKYRNMFGLPDDIDVEDCTMMGILGEDAFAKVEGSVRKALRGELVNYEVNISGKQPKILQVHYVPDYFDETVKSKGVRGFFMMALDVTELRITQSNYKKDLIKEVEEKTRHLSEAIKELESAQAQLLEQEKMASLGPLVSGIAHELNTPIGTSLTAVTCLLEKNQEISVAMEDKQLSTERLEGFLEVNDQVLGLAESNIQRATNLIDTFKKVSVREPLEDPTKFHLLGILNDAISMIETEYSEYRVKYQIDVLPVLSVHSYPELLLQVFSSLLDNSYTHGFSKQKPQRIVISAHCMSDVLKISYMDDGKGLTEQAKERMFDPFYSSKPASQSMGLGMTIIYNIIRVQLHGEIKLNKKINNGYHLDILLPLSPHKKIKPNHTKQ